MVKTVKNHMVRVLDASPFTHEIIKATTLAKMTEAQRQEVKVISIVAPRLGGSGFGGVLVEHKTPVYKVFK